MLPDFEQMGLEGKRLDAAPSQDYLRSPSSPFIFFGNRICPFAHRAWWAALEKGVDNIEYIHIDLGGKKPKWYQESIYDAGTVPCVFDGGKKVCESMNVAEYVEDKLRNSGTSLLPSDAFLRSEIRMLIAFFSEKVQRPLYQLLMNQDPNEDAQKRQNVSLALKALNDRYVERSPEGPYFLGKELSLADIAVVPFLERFVTTLKHYRSFDLFGPDTQRLKELVEECCKRPAFLKTNQTPEFYIRGYTGYANPKL